MTYLFNAKNSLCSFVAAQLLDTFLAEGFVMHQAFIFAYWLVEWFSSAGSDIDQYFHSLSGIQWGIMASSAVAFSFLCLKGTNINR